MNHLTWMNKINLLFNNSLTAHKEKRSIRMDLINELEQRQVSLILQAYAQIRSEIAHRIYYLNLLALLVGLFM